MSETMADRIMALMNRMRNGVSFVELSREVEGFKGDYEMELGNNVVVWEGMSKEAIEALSALRKEDRIYYTPTTPLVYFLDGVALNLPVAKRPQKQGYKKPHWLPIAVNLGPQKLGRGAR